jgi:hypothetical protein
MRGGFAFRYFLGIAHGTPVEAATGTGFVPLAFPYLGMGLGYAF